MKRIAILLGAALAGIAGATAGSFPENAAATGRTIVLAVFDTTRLDEIGAFGGLPGATPSLDALALDGTAYEAAFATDSFTFPSHTAMFSGRLTGTEFRLPAGGLTENLKAAGFRTVGVSANWILDRTTGFDRGFDFFTNVVDDATREELLRGPVDAEVRRERAIGSAVVETTRSALAGIGRRESLFLFVNLFDPHDPYTPGPEARARFAPHVQTSGHLRAVGGSLKNFLLDAPKLSQARRADLRRLYRGEVSQADAAFGALRTLLGEMGRRDGALVVAVADHGERLGEEDQWTHNLGLSEEEVHVPLIVAGPGVSRGRRVGEPVSLAAIGPALERWSRTGKWAPGTEAPLLFHHVYKGNEIALDPFTRRDVSGIVKEGWRITRGPEGCRLFARAAPLWRETPCDSSSAPASRLIADLNEQFRTRVGLPRLRSWTIATPTPEWVRQLRMLGYLAP